MRRLPCLLIVVVSACAPAAFSSEISGVDSATSAMQASLSALVAAQEYRGPAFRRVSQAPYHTALDDQDLIEVFVSAAASSSYWGLDPELSHAAWTFPEGGVIVREVQALGGAVAKVTLMQKGPAGYFPAGGDFFYGVTSPQGVFLQDEGVVLAGPIGDCGSCHADRSGDAFLFGVPAAVRVPAP